MKALINAFAFPAPSAGCLSAVPRPSPARSGEPAPPAAAERTIVIGANTRFVNVNHGEIVKFVANGQEFAWDFDGLPQVFDLKQVAPQGAIDHSVRVYIATTLNDGGLGD